MIFLLYIKKGEIIICACSRKKGKTYNSAVGFRAKSAGVHLKCAQRARATRKRLSFFPNGDKIKSLPNPYSKDFPGFLRREQSALRT